MKKLFSKDRLNRIPWTALLIVIVAVVAVIVASVAQRQSHQAADAIIPKLVFSGEYRISDGDWKPITEGEHISSTKGNVELRGVFKLYDEQSGMELGEADRGTLVSLYLNHVKVTIKDQSGNVWVSDSENELIGKNSCSEMWNQYLYEGNAGDELTVIIYNPHVFGNETAVDRFLENICIYTGSDNGGLLSYVGPMELVVGIILIAFLFVLFGVSLMISAFYRKYSGKVWLLWLLVFFGGIYFVFSNDNIGVWNPFHAANTMICGSSMMLYLLTAYALISSFLCGAAKKIAVTFTVLLGAASLGAMLVSLAPAVKFYNTYPYWIVFAVCVALVLGACIFADVIIRKKKGGADATQKYVYITSLVVLVIFIVDVAATLLGAWQGGFVSVLVLLAIVMTSVVVIGRVVPRSIRTVLDAKTIEAEKREMELKLQESHISIMLSQIQPHFLYNTLNSIYHLCETNPMRARSMVNSFSEYLRNNLSSLEEAGLISFETELSHINTYLDIEKVRFEDTLEIEYDIQCSDFSLPVLTVQPIVENAVKHGTSKKRGGGKVTISTTEDKENYIIKVSDTGCGFDPANPKNDGKRHVGLENVRQRLSNICDGSLTIESEVGVGTVATIKIPKGDKK